MEAGRMPDSFWESQYAGRQFTFSSVVDLAPGAKGMACSAPG